MKINILLWMGAVMLTLSSCSTSDSITDSVSLSKVSHSECENHSQTRTSYEPKLRLTYNAADQTITGEYINYMLSCDYTDAGINIEQDADGTLVLNPWNEAENMVDCICHINIYFTIHNVAMQNYHLVLNRRTVTVVEQDGSKHEETWTDYDGIISFKNQNVITIDLLVGSSSSDDEITFSDDDYDLPEGIGQNNLIPLYSSNDLSHNRKTQVETLGNWNVCIDDDGRYLWASLYDTGDPIEKLYAAPSSYEELSGKLFNLDDDHSLKLDTVEYYTDYEGYSRRADFYDEYYRGVPVLCGQYSFHFLFNSTEQHIHHCSGYFISFDNLDEKPAITGDQALQIFSAYLKKPMETSWTATLYAREYHVRVEGDTFRREQRLIYYVTGPAKKILSNMGGYSYEVDSNESAEIDAHTGQIIYTGVKHFIPF